MKKKLSALILSAILLFSSVPYTWAGFYDVTGETAVAAATLQGLDITSGTGADSFSPDLPLTRAQACTWVVNAMGLANQVNSYSRRTMFSDVKASSWYNGYVNLAYAEGLINGRGNGTFAPDVSVTYGEMATILLRMLKYTNEEIGSVWPIDYTSFCDDLKLSEGMALSSGTILTRGQAALLLYRTLKADVNGTQKAFYETMSGITDTEEAILMDVKSSIEEDNNLLMAYSMDNSGGIKYYAQRKEQSDALTGYVGTLLFDGSGSVVGFIPTSIDSRDVTIGSAGTTILTSKEGISHRISSNAMVIIGGDVYPYTTSGHIQLNSKIGKTVRIFYDDTGAITHLYLAGGTSSGSEAAVASSSSVVSSLVYKLGVSNANYSITKNGVAADESALAKYDVGYYDAGSNTLRISDYRVSGYVSEATPSISAAETITMAGHTFEVMECAWDTLKEFDMSDKITLLLTDDGKVAAAYSASILSADMVGVLSKDGRSVTLVGSEITLSAGSMNFSDDDKGSLVTVSMSSNSTMTCKRASGSSGTLDIQENTVGGVKIAPACSIYEWVGRGYVYDLEGNQGMASSTLDSITWTDQISSMSISYVHINSAGQADVILLNDITGNVYEYGSLKVTKDGINLGSGGMDAYNDAAILTNSSGTTSRHLYTASSSGGYVGAAFAQSSGGYSQIVRTQPLYSIGVSESDFFQLSSQWYLEYKDEVYPVSDDVEIYISTADTWICGESGLINILSDGYDLTAYYDRSSSQGGQIRILVANPNDE